jgi:acyl carrier protein
MLAAVRPEHDFTASRDYFKDGLLDSLDVLALVGMLEREFDIVIPGAAVVPENFRDVEALGRLVAELTASASRRESA